jgi:fatty acid desaturase
LTRRRALCGAAAANVHRGIVIMPTSLPIRPGLRLNSPQMLRRINALRRTDNWTNWFFLAREYLFLGCVVGLAIAFDQYRASCGLGRAWDVPVALLAIALVGVGQHRLAVLAHEASHYLLFRNRLLNELASDFLCMFPLASVTHYFRLQHFAHHQYTNDPQRDSTVAHLEAVSRHAPPLPPGRFLWEWVVKPLCWPPTLFRYFVLQARYAGAGVETGPHRPRGTSRGVTRVNVLYLITLPAVTTYLAVTGHPGLLAAAAVALWAAILAFHTLVPERCYLQTPVKSDVPRRWTMILRMTHLTLQLTTPAVLTWLTGWPWIFYYFVLWVVPLETTFALCLVLRELAQHGNAGPGRFTNTRVILAGRLVRWAVLPLGMDYHLPHHLFPLVPHYRLRALHDLLAETEEYRRDAAVAEGYFWPPAGSVGPTVLELMAQERATFAAG